MGFHLGIIYFHSCYLCVLNLNLSHIMFIHSLTHSTTLSTYLHVPGQVPALGLNPSFLLPDPDTYHLDLTLEWA